GIHRIEDTVYISNLPQEVTEEKLAEHFGSIGIIKTDKKLRKPKTTLTYDDPPSADAAIEWFGGKEFMGNIIQVTKAERKMVIPRGGRGGFRDQHGGGGGGGRGGSMGNREPREGDWTCDDCGANNFSRRDECFKCHASRPGGSSRGSRDDYRKDGRNERRDRPY
ncbi:hypothetical protein BD408DRAFT_355199, partial [Parasitella parasitica]